LIYTLEGNAVPEEAMTVFEIRIKRIISANGQQGFTLSMPEEYSFIEAMGLLDAAKWQMFQQMTHMYGD
jgi:hypothetical protein